MTTAVDRFRPELIFAACGFDAAMSDPLGRMQGHSGAFREMTQAVMTLADAALALMRKWWDEIAPQIGWTHGQARISTGSIGAAESTMQVEIALDDLGALHTAWTRLAEAAGQADWAVELEPHIVSGSPRW